MCLDTRMNGWFWGNIVIGGLFGSSTDGVSGAVYAYSPSQYLVTLEQTGGNGLGGRVLNSQAEKVREFIVVSYDNIISNLSKGEGPHLASLLNLLEVLNEEKNEAVKNLQTFSEKFTDVLGFAEQVIKFYIKKEE